MENHDIRTLRLLEAMENDEAPSQRELARKLDISLGLVNAFVKRLARKGYFKITNLPANRVRYLLTPKGMAEKTRLTCEYIQYSFNYYRETRARLAAIFSRLENGRGRRLVFWGSGELAEIAYVSMAGTDLKLVAVVDPGREGEVFLGRKVSGTVALAGLEYDHLLVTDMVSPEEFRSNPVLQAVAPDKLIFAISSPLSPVPARGGNAVELGV